MTTNKISRIFLLLVLSTLASSQEHQESLPSGNLDQRGINCNGRSAVCVGPLMYKECTSDSRGIMYASGNAKRCPTNSRCVNDGDEICVPLRILTDAPVSEAKSSTIPSVTVLSPTTDGPISIPSTESSIAESTLIETTNIPVIPYVSSNWETTYDPLGITNDPVITTIIPDKPKENTLLTTLEPDRLLETTTAIEDTTTDSIYSTSPAVTTVAEEVKPHTTVVSTTVLPDITTSGNTDPNYITEPTITPAVLIDTTYLYNPSDLIESSTPDNPLVYPTSSLVDISDTEITYIPTFDTTPVHIETTIPSLNPTNVPNSADLNTFIPGLPVETTEPFDIAVEEISTTTYLDSIQTNSILPLDINSLIDRTTAPDDQTLELNIINSGDNPTTVAEETTQEQTVIISTDNYELNDTNPQDNPNLTLGPNETIEFPADSTSLPLNSYPSTAEVVTDINGNVVTSLYPIESSPPVNTNTEVTPTVAIGLDFEPNNVNALDNLHAPVTSTGDTAVQISQNAVDNPTTTINTNPEGPTEIIDPNILDNASATDYFDVSYTTAPADVAALVDSSTTPDQTGDGSYNIADLPDESDIADAAINDSNATGNTNTPLESNITVEPFGPDYQNNAGKPTNSNVNDGIKPDNSNALVASTDIANSNVPVSPIIPDNTSAWVVTNSQVNDNIAPDNSNGLNESNITGVLNAPFDSNHELSESNTTDNSQVLIDLNDSSAPTVQTGQNGLGIGMTSGTNSETNVTPEISSAPENSDTTLHSSGINNQNTFNTEVPTNSNSNNANAVDNSNEPTTSTGTADSTGSTTSNAVDISSSIVASSEANINQNLFLQPNSEASNTLGGLNIQVDTSATTDSNPSVLVIVNPEAPLGPNPTVDSSGAVYQSTTDIDAVKVGTGTELSDDNASGNLIPSSDLNVSPNVSEQDNQIVAGESLPAGTNSETYLTSGISNPPVQSSSTVYPGATDIQNTAADSTTSVATNSNSNEPNKDGNSSKPVTPTGTDESLGVVSPIVIDSGGASTVANSGVNDNIGSLNQNISDNENEFVPSNSEASSSNSQSDLNTPVHTAAPTDFIGQSNHIIAGNPIESDIVNNDVVGSNVDSVLITSINANSPAGQSGLDYYNIANSSPDLSTTVNVIQSVQTNSGTYAANIPSNSNVPDYSISTAGPSGSDISASHNTQLYSTTAKYNPSGIVYQANDVISSPPVGGNSNALLPSSVTAGDIGQVSPSTMYKPGAIANNGNKPTIENAQLYPSASADASGSVKQNTADNQITSVVVNFEESDQDSGGGISSSLADTNSNILSYPSAVNPNLNNANRPEISNTQIYTNVAADLSESADTSAPGNINAQNDLIALVVTDGPDNGNKLHDPSASGAQNSYSNQNRLPLTPLNPVYEFKPQNSKKSETSETESAEYVESIEENLFVEDKSEEKNDKKKEEEEEEEQKEKQNKRNEQEKKKKKKEEEKQEEKKKKKEEKQEEKKEKKEEKKKKEEQKKVKREKKKQEDKEKESKEEDESSEKLDEHELRKQHEAKKELIKKIIENIENERCSDEDDTYADVRDCKKYYRCFRKSGKIKFIHLHCDDDKRFDFEESKCVKKNKAHCLV